MRQKGLIHIPILILLITGVAIGTAFLVNQNPNQDVKGTLIAHEDSDDDSDSSGSSGRGSSGSGSSGSSKSDDDKSSSSGSGSSGSTSNQTTLPEGVRFETKTSAEKQKTEIRFSEEERIKTKVEKDKARIEVRSGGVKVRYELKDGQLVVKVENEAGEELELEDEEIEQIEDEVEEELEDDGIKIASAAGKLAVVKNKFAASTNFPLSINPDTNELIVTTPAGQKVVTILPDQAVQNMLATNVISRLGTQAIVDAALQNQVASASAIIALGVRNNVPIYEIPGIRDFRLLGFIPVSAPVTAVVSAETGKLVTAEQPLLTRIVDLLSP